ncbi:MAG: YicC family protein [Alphaproteobacteria bacterium]|uniref:YicC family protein n=1 Tax=Candidatus Nitrobium versatile TaxID=2884831 RepID=A0A953M1E3_9BACT|nr:YicC family protein [Candidatus Nitrobium versatile]
MIQSMTGFGAAEVGGFKVEVRSLNHRYLEVSVRMPSPLLEHEIPVRNLIKEKFGRGKVDVTVSLTDKRKIRVTLNRELARGLYDAFSDLQRDLSLSGSLSLDLFASYKDLLLAEDSEYNAESLYEALRTAVDRVGEMRAREGETLGKELQRHAERLEELRREVEELARDAAPAYKETLSRRVAELLAGTPLDEARLAQEVALIAQRSDITEEVARLKSHLRQFASILEKGGSVGRKLDFLIQELNREANTIASKVDDVRIINLAIEMKTGIEKLREQVQNIQ